MATTRKTPTARPIAKKQLSKPQSLMSETEVSDAEKLRDAELAAEELLADMPELKPVHRLRIKERNRLMRLVLDSEIFNQTGVTEADKDNVDPTTLNSILSIVEGIDDFAESIARDPEQYVEWSEGKSWDTFLAILNRYSAALGK
jgi:hypothetical protein